MILLTDDWHKQDLARAVPGAFYSREHKSWVLEDATPRGAMVALRCFPHLALEYPELVELREELAQDVRPHSYADELDLRVAEAAARVRSVLADEEKDFYDFQNLDLGYLAAAMRKHGSAYVGWERGLGKTLATCALIDALDVRRALVVCPNTAKRSVWAEELKRFLPHATVLVLPNEKRKRERMMHRVEHQKLLLPNTAGPQVGDDDYYPVRPPLILVIHYEALAIIDGPKKNGWKRLGQWGLVAADEAHRIKNPKAKMTRALKRVPAQHKLALSGSVIQNHPEELYSPLNWLFPQTYRAKWRDWNDRYLEYIDNGFGKLCIGVKPEKLDQLSKELGVFMVYRRKEDELDLPDKTEQTLLVDLSPSQRRAYDQLRDEYVTRLDDGSVVAAGDGLVLLTRLRQVATGLDLVGQSVTDSSKLDHAEELVLDNPDEATVVFSWFKTAARALAERLEAKGVGVFLVTGDTPQEDRADYIARFQAGEGQVFIGTISTLGESVNLYRATQAIFIDRSWNPADNAQAQDRIYRIGQTKPVTITHLVARDTVDETRVQHVIKDKEFLRRMILGS